VLGIASVLAIWLFIRPPEDKAPAAADRPASTATSTFSATATATAPGDRPSPTATAVVLPATSTPVITPSPTPPTNTYEVQPGDTLGAIAEESDTTVEEILAANPEITDPGSIAPGQIIIIP
jgi:LysM repeat protein